MVMWELLFFLVSHHYFRYCKGHTQTQWNQHLLLSAAHSSSHALRMHCLWHDHKITAVMCQVRQPRQRNTLFRRCTCQAYKKQSTFYTYLNQKTKPKEKKKKIKYYQKSENQPKASMRLKHPCLAPLQRAKNFPSKRTSGSKRTSLPRRSQI